MGILDTLFGGRQAATSAPSQDASVVDFFDGILTLGDFTGLYASSTDGRWTVAWSDRDAANRRGGARTSGHGIVLLIDGKTVVRTSRELQRPNDGTVADDGTVAINDWLFSDGLNGVFYVLAPSGAIRVKQRFAANLYNTGIAADGSVACVQTCGAANDDGGVLSVFAVATGQCLARIQPSSGWADRYRFDLAAKQLWLGYKDGSEFAYSLTGEFLDGPRWCVHVLAHGDFYQVMTAIEGLIEGRTFPWPADIAARVLPAAVRAAGVCTASASTVAKAWKVAGQAAQSLGDTATARTHFEHALALDPKVGVKKLLAALTKSGTDPSARL